MELSRILGRRSERFNGQLESLTITICPTCSFSNPFSFFLTLVAAQSFRHLNHFLNKSFKVPRRNKKQPTMARGDHLAHARKIRDQKKVIGEFNNKIAGLRLASGKDEKRKKQLHDELDKLVQRRDSLQQELLKLEEKITKDLQEKQDELEEKMTKDLQEKKDELEGQERQLLEKQGEVARQQEQLQKLQEQTQQEQENTHATASKSSLAQQELTKKVGELDTLQKSLEGLKEEIAVAKKTLQDLEEEITKAKASNEQPDEVIIWIVGCNANKPYQVGPNLPVSELKASVEEDFGIPPQGFLRLFLDDEDGTELKLSEETTVKEANIFNQGSSVLLGSDFSDIGCTKGPWIDVYLEQSFIGQIRPPVGSQPCSVLLSHLNVLYKWEGLSSTHRLSIQTGDEFTEISSTQMYASLGDLQFTDESKIVIAPPKDVQLDKYVPIKYLPGTDANEVDRNKKRNAQTLGEDRRGEGEERSGKKSKPWQLQHLTQEEAGKIEEPKLLDELLHQSRLGSLGGFPHGTSFWKERQPHMKQLHNQGEGSSVLSFGHKRDEKANATTIGCVLTRYVVYPRPWFGPNTTQPTPNHFVLDANMEKRAEEAAGVLVSYCQRMKMESGELTNANKMRTMNLTSKIKYFKQCMKRGIIDPEYNTEYTRMQQPAYYKHVLQINSVLLLGLTPDQVEKAKVGQHAKSLLGRAINESCRGYPFYPPTCN